VYNVGTLLNQGQKEDVMLKSLVLLAQKAWERVCYKDGGTCIRDRCKGCPRANK